MNPQQMTQQVNAELAHIPDWPGEYQGLLRMLYNARRRASLGQNAAGNQSVADVLLACIASIHSQNPGADLHFDEAFFGVNASQIAAS